MKDVGMASTFSVMMNHASEPLYTMALKKVQSFIRGRILETKIAGKIAASLCRCLVWARPEKGLPAFVPQACDIITDLLTDDTIAHENLIDEELKFNMLILSEVCFGNLITKGSYFDQISFVVREDSWPSFAAVFGADQEHSEEILANEEQGWSSGCVSFAKESPSFPDGHIFRRLSIQPPRPRCADQRKPSHSKLGQAGKYS